MHGTSLSAAKQIAQEGLCRQDRLHIHFYECDLGVKPLNRGEYVRASSEVIIIASAEKCENLGIVFYRAPNGVILSEGLSGIISSERFLCARRLPCYEVLWPHLTRGWQTRSDPNLPTQPMVSKMEKVEPSSKVHGETLSSPGLRRAEMGRSTGSSRDANDQAISPPGQAGREIEKTEEAHGEMGTGGRKRARSRETLRALSICNTDKWNSYSDLPTPKQLFDSDQDMTPGESPTVFTELTQVFRGKTNADRRSESYTSFSRTAVSPMSRSAISREVDSQTSDSPSNSEQLSSTNITSATTVIDYVPTPDVSEATKKFHPGWTLGQPYYLSDGPAAPSQRVSVTDRIQEITPCHPGIMNDYNAPPSGNQTVRCAMTWGTTGATGMLTPPCFDPRWNSPMSSDMRPCGWAGPGSSWGSSPVGGVYAGGGGQHPTSASGLVAQENIMAPPRMPFNQPSPVASPRP